MSPASAASTGSPGGPISGFDHDSTAAGNRYVVPQDPNIGQGNGMKHPEQKVGYTAGQTMTVALTGSYRCPVILSRCGLIEPPSRCAAHRKLATLTPLPADLAKKQSVRVKDDAAHFKLPALPLPDISAPLLAPESRSGNDDIINTAFLSDVRRIQDAHRAHILLVQVGSFYEIYDHSGYLDEIAGLLRLKIASHKSNRDRKMRFAGVPVIKVRDYLQTLLKSGKTVALVDQVGRDEANKSKLFKREVTRVFTPGTVIDEDLFDGSENNFIMTISCDESVTSDRLGLAWLDVSTGEFLVADSDLATFEEHLGRIQPREVVCDETTQQKHPRLIDSLRMRSDQFHITFQPREIDAKQLLIGLMTRCGNEQAPSEDQISDDTSSSTIGKFPPLQIQAAGSLLGYLQKSLILPPIFAIPTKFEAEKVMHIDAVTQQALEITRSYKDGSRKGSLLKEVDATKTAAGSRLLTSRLNSTFLSDIRHMLSDVKDTERALQRIHCGKGLPADYTTLMATLRIGCDIIARLRRRRQQPVHDQASSASNAKALNVLMSNLAVSEQLSEDCDVLFNDNNTDISDIDAIRTGLSEQLDTLRAQYRQLEQRKENLLKSFQVNYVIEDSRGRRCGCRGRTLCKGPGSLTAYHHGRTALISIMAQTGMYVPASNAKLGIVDKIFARVGASDDLMAHKSTFMVEMQETANILKNVTEKSFVIMDEVGRGTSSHDGLAIAYAVFAYLYQNAKCRAVFATHYHELPLRIVERENHKFGNVKCYQTAVLTDEVCIHSWVT
ncbi:unnamed protein product [Sphagnum tenellum]